MMKVTVQLLLLKTFGFSNDCGIVFVGEICGDFCDERLQEVGAVMRDGKMVDNTHKHHQGDRRDNRAYYIRQQWVVLFFRFRRQLLILLFPLLIFLQKPFLRMVPQGGLTQYLRFRIHFLSGCFSCTLSLQVFL